MTLKPDRLIGDDSGAGPQISSLNINLISLEQALHVSELGSFRKAAKLLEVQPSVVSRAVRGLEDAIGVSLFQRQVQGAHPTRAGERILPRIRRVVEEVRLIIRAGQLAGEGREGVLCIGSVVSFAGGGARDLLASFLHAHPDIELHLVDGGVRDHVGAVRALRMDAAIVVGHPSAPDCIVEPLWSEPIMVAVARGHRLAERGMIAWRDLSTETFLVSRADPGPEIQDYIVQHLATLGRHPTVEQRAVGRDGLMSLVGFGQGLTLVTGAEASATYQSVVFRPLDDERLPIGLMWSERNDNPLLRRFMSLARRWSREQEELHQPNAAPLQTPDPLP